MGIKNKYVCSLLVSLMIISIVVIIDILGLDFMALKLVSVPFVPTRDIDNMSDYYTAVWGSVNRETIDDERLEIVDVTENDRSQIVDILRKVNEMKPAIIGLDVIFDRPEGGTIDSLLISTIQSVPNIILPIEYETKQGGEEFYASFFSQSLNPKMCGVISIPDNRNVHRYYRPCYVIDKDTIDAFGCVIAQKAGADISDLLKRKQLLINYTTCNLHDDDAIRGGDFLNLSSRDSMFMASRIQNKIVIVGATHHTKDFHLTPLGFMSGPLIHAHIINSILESKNIKTIPTVIRYFLCFILAFVLFVIYGVMNPRNADVNKSWGKILMYYVLAFLLSQIVFAGVGTAILCKCCYYIDFAPYIVTLIISYFFINNKLIFFQKHA